MHLTSTSDFDCEYLRNESRCPKSEAHMIEDKTDDDDDDDDDDDEKSPVNFGPLTRSRTCEFGPTLMDFFGRLHFCP